MFIHFVNCFALTFGPYFIFYKTTPLSEFHAIWVCFYAAMAYLLTQGVKVVLFAVLLPIVMDDSFYLSHEVAKALLSSVDLLGIYITLNQRLGVREIRILGVGLGWAMAESLVLRLATMWLGTRQAEFSWEYLQTGVEANISFVLIMAFTTFVWLWSRVSREPTSSIQKVETQERKKWVPYILGGLIVYLAMPIVVKYLQHILLLEAPYLLFIHIVVAFIYAYVAKTLYTLILSKPQVTKKKQ